MTTIIYSLLTFILVGLIYFTVMGTGVILANLIKNSKLWKTLW